ncbi:MAG: hypothetical protein NZ941_01195 [Candidatus Caldarchaeum sp.]|nr:hypothetical protein [Candidatus Caldarchaeum sp.]
MKAVKQTLICPVCRSTNLLPAKPEANVPQVFECLECGTQFSIIKPRILGYEVGVEESEEDRKRKRTLAEVLDGILLGWLLRK